MSPKTHDITGVGSSFGSPTCVQLCIGTEPYHSLSQNMALQSILQAIVVSPLLLGQQKQWWQRMSTVSTMHCIMVATDKVWASHKGKGTSGYGQDCV